MNKTQLWQQTYNYLQDYYTNKEYKHVLNTARRLNLPYPLDLFPRTVNLAQSTYYMKRKARMAINRILPELKQLPKNYIKSHLFTEFITFPDQSTISQLEVKKMNADITKLRLKQKRNGINTLIASNEAVIDKDQSFNQHNHGLILTSNSTSTTELTNYYTKWINHYQKSNHNYKVIIKRFKITKTNLKSSIKAFIQYVLKQYRLPYLKNQYEKYNYKKIPKSQRRVLLNELINAYKSTRTAYIIQNNTRLTLNLTEINKDIITNVLKSRRKKSGLQKYSHNSNTYIIQFKPNPKIQQQQQVENKGNIVTNIRFSGIPP